ncbi:hypothetical protein D049_2021B, partial [Vibrio parahaemolyticus VPTS-2010]
QFVIGRDVRFTFCCIYNQDFCTSNA